MEAQQIENVIQSNISVLLGEYGWMFLAALVVLFFKTTIESTIAGLLLFCGNDYNNDDIVVLGVCLCQKPRMHCVNLPRSE